MEAEPASETLVSLLIFKLRDENVKGYASV
jgi:hypothetical protein